MPRHYKRRKTALGYKKRKKRVYRKRKTRYAAASMNRKPPPQKPIGPSWGPDSPVGPPVPPSKRFQPLGDLKYKKLNSFEVDRWNWRLYWERKGIFKEDKDFPGKEGDPIGAWRKDLGRIGPNISNRPPKKGDPWRPSPKNPHDVQEKGFRDLRLWEFLTGTKMHDRWQYNADHPLPTTMPFGNLNYPGMVDPTNPGYIPDMNPHV